MIVKYYKQGTSVAGTLSFNTDDLRGVCHRIFIKPHSSSVSYNFKLTDDNSLDIYLVKGIKGSLNDLSQHTLRGIYTASFTSISSNGLFTVQIEYQEIA